MKFLRLTKYRRICLQQMLNDLFGEFDKVKLKRNGFVIFKKNKWKFWKREKVHVSELIIKEIPQRIERFTSRFSKKAYPYWKQKNVQREVFKIINGHEYRDVIEFLWKEHSKIRFPLGKMKPSEALISQYSHVKHGSISLRNIYNRYCNSFTRPSIMDWNSILSQIKKLSEKREKPIIKIRFRGIQNPGWFPVQHLAAA